MTLTSLIPPSTLSPIMYLGPILAAKGVSIVSMEDIKIPIPNTCLPPNFIASKQPGI